MHYDHHYKSLIITLINYKVLTSKLKVAYTVSLAYSNYKAGFDISYNFFPRHVSDRFLSPTLRGTVLRTTR